MSGNIAVIYAGDLAAMAETFGEAAAHLASRVRLLGVGGDQSDERADADPRADLGDLEWADGIAFGTPIGGGAPAPILMRFIASTEPLWSSGRLYDKAVTVFTDEPEHFAPDSVLHPIYDALYRWGAVIIGNLLRPGPAGRRRIDTCQYRNLSICFARYEAPDRPGCSVAPGSGRPGTTRHPSPAERCRRGLRLRFHGLLQSQSAHDLAPPEGAS